MPGKIENYLKQERDKGQTLLLVLIDSEISNATIAVKLARSAKEAGAAAVLVGGSSAIDQKEMGATVARIKDAIEIPVILFPGNITGIVPEADAILFSTLMNSENPYFITQAQALGAPTVLKFGLEPLPTAYLIVGEGASAWFVGNARGIPPRKPEIAAAYALAARFLGMRFVYLEAGSGAASTVKPEMIQAVRRVFDGLLMVGGGIRSAESARALANAGADILIVGTLLERDGDLDKLGEIARALQNSSS